MGYHNTTKLAGEDLIESKEDAIAQERMIYAWMLDRSGMDFTPFEVKRGTGISCINSVRRAMTDLTSRGLLVKTGNRRISGPFRKRNFCWTAPAESQTSKLN